MRSRRGTGWSAIFAFGASPRQGERTVVHVRDVGVLARIFDRIGARSRAFGEAGALSRVFSASRAARRLDTARERELAGDFERAAASFVEAGEPDEAARVLLLLADAESDARRKLGALARAAAIAPADSPRRREAQRRSALVKLDLARPDGHGPALPSELRRLGEELAALGEHERAAEAYALAGDVDAEARELERAGDIDELERVLDEDRERARSRRQRDEIGRRLVDLDAMGRRRAALAEADAWLGAHPDDATIAARARALRAKRLEGPRVRLAVEGTAIHALLGEEVTIGRGEATLVVSSPAVSRRHLRLARRAIGIVVEDLGGRNGTFLAGARLDGALPVGGGLDLSLGGEVRCVVTPSERGGVTIDVAGERWIAPLGPMRVGPFEIRLAGAGAVELASVDPAVRPVLGGLVCTGAIELAAGDRVGAERDGPAIVEVPA